ncbi:MAG: PEP-utilizing enzyme [Desulfobacterales bacterium]|jgi:pyruvate,water dikinase|nr:PEP-utilizing enzyme [Desulfobacterales bacterium]
MTLRLFSFLKRKKGPSREELMRSFKEKYDNFKLLLESNTELLKIISDIEQKLRGKSGFGLPYIEAQTMRAFFHCGRMIQCLEKMSGRPYSRLKEALADIQNAIKGEAPAAARKACTEYTLAYADIGRENAEAVGEKNANLAEVANRMGLRVPRGFAITTAGFARFMDFNRLTDVFLRLKAKADVIETQTILQVSEQAQLLIAESDVPEDLADAIRSAYDRMLAETPAADLPLHVALRSSAIGEDSVLSFAGQYLSVLNVTLGRLLAEYKNILASLFTPRAIAYRLHMGIPFPDAAMAVACLEMVRSKVSGVMYTRNPINPLENRIIINAVWGLGPYAVDGIVPPDSYVFTKDPDLVLASTRIQEKSARLVALADGSLAKEDLPPETSRTACLSEEQAQGLARMGLALEAHFGAPQDIEWAMDAKGEFVILQTRPLQIETREAAERAATSGPPPGAELLLENAEVACAGSGCGPVIVVRSDSDLVDFPDGGVLVAVHPSPQFVMAMSKAQAIITDFGSLVSHMASLAREYMVPTLMNTRCATTRIPAGTEVTVDAYTGRVYRGRVPELLEAGPAAGGFVIKGPTYMALRRRADLIVPLHLTDPKSPEFSEKNCRTLHDIMRFIHENSYAIVFQLGDLVTDRASISTKLLAPLPIDLFVIDILGGLSVDGTRVSSVKPEQVVSVPFKALLQGMLREDLGARQPRPVNLSGFFSVMSEQMLSPGGAGNERFGDRSYAIISDKYLNFSSRVGYHYSVLDCYCGKTPAKNYIHFQFKGGAADELRRGRRARMIQKALASLGFLVETTGDRVSARIAKQDESFIQEKLDLLGRLLIFTRQMDMMMHTEGHVDQLTECFLSGNYSLDPCRMNPPPSAA